ncbi:hypothetical protein CsSME_00032573 [Camellia sinensis var. sinensis]
MNDIGTSTGACQEGKIDINKRTENVFHDYSKIAYFGEIRVSLFRTRSCQQYPHRPHPLPQPSLPTLPLPLAHQFQENISTPSPLSPPQPLLQPSLPPPPLPLHLKGSNYSVIHTSNEKLELSFRSTYDPSTPGIRLPLSVDLRYIMRSGVSGFYCYAIYERPPGCRAFDLAQTRMVFKLRREK